MKNTNAICYIQAAIMQDCFEQILNGLQFSTDRAKQIAAVFTQNSVEGIYTHGVYRFPRFVEYVKKGLVQKDALAIRTAKFNGIEQWDGQLAPGISNAIAATEQCMQLASENGIGCVALSNTNHWMRGGTYGWQAAKAGYVFIGWTNTIANMPAWGAIDAKLGNNPLVIAVPYKNDAIVIDMAMSQYSFGAMELAVVKKELLAVYGGFSSEGVLTTDPSEIIHSRRPLPIGYWKGAGLSLLLDILAAILSGGAATHTISKREIEQGLSQVFIAIDITKLPNHSTMPGLLQSIIDDYHQSVAQDSSTNISYPGERVLKTRQNNLVNGIPVVQSVWQTIEALK
jgi:3-dehydro-L-gulonate 2-dehydrogenase